MTEKEKKIFTDYRTEELNKKKIEEFVVENMELSKTMKITGEMNKEMHDYYVAFDKEI